MATIRWRTRYFLATIFGGRIYGNVTGRVEEIASPPSNLRLIKDVYNLRAVGISNGNGHNNSINQFSRAPKPRILKGG